MTDRAKGCLVVFDADYRTDDLNSLTAAILQLKGVVAVQLSLTAPEDYMNRQRVMFELQEKLLRVLERGSK